MKTIVFSTLAGLGLLSAACSVSAAELLVTGASDKRGDTVSIALDLVSDGTTRGFDFVIPVGQAKGVKVNTAKCMVSLPSGFQGECRFNGSEIAGIAFSWERKALPEGVYSLGTVTISGGSLLKSASGDFEVKFNAADMSGKAIEANTRTDLDVQSRPASVKSAAESTK